MSSSDSTKVGAHFGLLREALRPFADAFDVNSADGPCLTEADVRAMYQAVGVQDFRMASQALTALSREAPPLSPSEASASAPAPDEKS